MKFMKLGSKPDSFQTEGNNVRYVASELATDIVVNVGDVKFYLHKFPLLSKSALLQKIVTNSNEGTSDEVEVHDIPGGPAAFEICAKFCYSMTVTLNAYNVIAARCAAEYLGMNENIEKGNLVYKIDVFLNSSIFRSWKDSIIVLQTTKTVLPFAEELKLVSICVESIASKASVDVYNVDWSYTYNRKKLPEENGNDPNWNGLRSRNVPKDWWVDDLCELEMDLYKRVIISIKNKGMVSSEIIGEALKSYALRRLNGFSKGAIQCGGDIAKSRMYVETIVWLLPSEKGSVSCGFLLNLLKAAYVVDLGENAKGILVKIIGEQLEEAKVDDLLIRAQEGDSLYDVDVIKRIVKQFMVRDKIGEFEENNDEILEVRRPGILSEASKLMVAKLVDGYLTEIAKDPNLSLLTFVDLTEMVSGFIRPAHDGLYRAIDTYLKVHPGISKSERKKICKLMDCKKLSVDACMHAVQNERLPLRVVVQVLFFEQVRAAASSGSSTPDLPKAIKNLNSGSHGSSRSANTNAEEEWDAVATAEELRALKAELASLRLAGNGAPAAGNESSRVLRATSGDKAAISKMKSLLMSKRVFSKIWSNKVVSGENSGSDSSGSLGSGTQPEEVKSTPSRKGRHSVS